MSVSGSKTASKPPKPTSTKPITVQLVGMYNIYGIIADAFSIDTLWLTYLLVCSRECSKHIHSDTGPTLAIIKSPKRGDQSGGGKQVIVVLYVK